MKKMLICKDGEQLGFARLMDFFLKNKPYLFFDWEDIVSIATFYDEECLDLDEIEWHDELKDEVITGHALIAVKTMTGYLIGVHESGSYRWYRFTEAPVIPSDYVEVDKETAIKTMLTRLPRNKDFAKGTWSIRDFSSISQDDDRVALNVKLDEFLTGKIQRWDFHDDAVFDSDCLWSLIDGALVLRNESGEDIICDIDSLVWSKGKMIAVDFRRGCYVLGVYRQ